MKRGKVFQPFLETSLLFGSQLGCNSFTATPVISTALLRKILQHLRRHSHQLSFPFPSLHSPLKRATSISVSMVSKASYSRETWLVRNITIYQLLD